ncbi:MAG: ATP-binding protein [Myxococcota bacterium]
MTAFEGILGQDTAVQTLRRAVSSDRLASAYLFEGPGGVGKRTAALELAATVLAADAPAVRDRILAGHHPDVRVHGPREDGAHNIQVEYLREEVLPFTQFAPFEARAAFLIFPDADVSFPETHPEAANALLKTLEEPRRGVHFVLTSDRPDRLLPTIRSRCQRLRFNRLARPVLERILAEQGMDETVRDEVIALAGGRADRAIALAAEGEGRQLLDLALKIDAAVAAGRPGSLTEAAETMARSDHLPLILDTLATFYRDVACAGLELGDDRLTFRHQAAAVRERATHVSPGLAARRVELLREAAGALERNANAQITMDALLFQL